MLVKADYLYEMFVNGRNCIIESNDFIDELESCFEKGMKGVVMSMKEFDKDLYEIQVDLKTFERYNLIFMKPVWYKKGDLFYKKATFTSIDAGYWNTEETFFIDKTTDIEVLDDESMSVYNDYIASKSVKSYVVWLEDFYLSCKATKEENKISDQTDNGD